MYRPYFHNLDEPPFPFDDFAEIVGGHNWVIAARTPNIVRQYGADVVCLSSQRYNEAERVARLRLTDGLD